MANVLANELRDAVVQAAIQGNLTEHFESDTPVQSLLLSIEKEKEQLIKDKKIKKEKPLSSINEEEIPFGIPFGWKWVRIGDLSKLITKGSSPKWQGVSYVENGVLFITSENVGKNEMILNHPKYVEFKFNEISPRSILAKGDILTNLVGGSIGRTAVYNKDENANINQAVCIIRLIDKRITPYLLLYMNSNVAYNIMMEDKVDTARANISLTNINEFLVPLPPVEEQQRIVERVEELMAKIDEYEKIEKQLVELKKEFPGDMRDAILQAAMEGRIFDNTNIEKWDEYKLSNLADIYTGNSIPESIKKSKYMKVEKGYDFIATKDVGFDHVISYNNGVKIPCDEPKFRIAYSGATLLCIEGGSAGKKIGIIDKEVCFGNKLCSFNPNEKVLSMFLYYYLQSPQFTNVFKDNISGMIGGVGINKIKNMTMLLPPIEEQQRIVEILDKLLPLCDGLV